MKLFYQKHGDDFNKIILNLLELTFNASKTTLFYQERLGLFHSNLVTL